MRLGASLFLIALGAILTFAVTVHNGHGFNVNTIGIILMIVGALGLVLTVIMMSTRRRTDIVEQGGPGTHRRTTYLEPNDPVDPSL